MSSSTEAIRAALDRVEELEEMRRTGTNYAIVQLAEEGLAEWTPRFAKALSLALEVLERDAASEVMYVRADAQGALREIAALLSEEAQ